MRGLTVRIGGSNENPKRRAQIDQRVVALDAHAKQLGNDARKVLDERPSTPTEHNMGRLRRFFTLAIGQTAVTERQLAHPVRVERELPDRTTTNTWNITERTEMKLLSQRTPWRLPLPSHVKTIYTISSEVEGSNVFGTESSYRLPDAVIVASGIGSEVRLPNTETSLVQLEKAVNGARAFELRLGSIAAAEAAEQPRV